MKEDNVRIEATSPINEIESNKDSNENSWESEDSVQASIDKKKLMYAMKKRKSNYNAIIKKHK